jgi:hypothetical protein
MTVSSRFHLILLGLTCWVLGGTPIFAQSVTVLPHQIPNGVTAPSKYKQRIDIALNPDTGLTRSFTITLPPEVSLVSGSVTATSNASSLVAYFAGLPASNQLSFGLTGSTSGRTVTVEFDVRTPITYSGVASGSVRDTAYTIDFASGMSSNADQSTRVQLHQNKRLRIVQFSQPDSARGDTTDNGGRFHKLKFNSIYSGSGLPDLEHTGLSGLSVSRGFTDTKTDVTYSFYISSDSTLVRKSGQAAAGMFVIGADDTPLAGQRQRPRVMPATFIREDFTSTFSDSTEGVISLSGTANNAVYYVYVASDETSDWFLGRSGPLLVKHPPQFIIAGWDYDDDGGDNYNNTGLIQVPSELISGGGQKDNNNVTIDSGRFLSRGSAVPQTGFSPSPISQLDMLYQLEDVDNQGQVSMAIWLVPDSLSLTTADLVPAATLDSLRSSYKLSKSDTLTADSHVYTFQPLTRSTATNLITSFVPSGSYHVYFGAKDNASVTLYRVRQDPFENASTLAILTVAHSPTLQIDATQFNDLDGDGDLDVETGIGVSQMITDGDGRNLGFEPSNRFVTISWARAGLDGDLDVDGEATIDLFYTTRSNYNVVGGSEAYTSGNSDGSDLLDDISQNKTDTHEIVSGISMKPDGPNDNLYAWDLWNYVSAAGTIPAEDRRYYIYGLLKGGGVNRLVSFTDAGALNFKHPPYGNVIEPAASLNVTVNEPVQVSWLAIDLDNSGASGAVPAKGLSAPNGRTTSPNIRILLSSADFGDVTTWGSITNAANTSPTWIGNSGDGSLAEEVELNEGVDTSFVVLGNRMRNSLNTSQSLKIGQQMFVYLAIDGQGAGDQPADFSARSPLIKAPGSITFSGTVPTDPPTSSRLIVPKSIQAHIGQVLQFPVVPERTAAAASIEVVNLYMTVDTTYFFPLDMDPGTAGIQPFTAGTKDSLSVAKIQQAVYYDPTAAGVLRLDFRYDDAGGNGLTFFDGVKPLVFLNLTVKNKTGATNIVINNSGTRNTNMLDDNLAVVAPFSIEPDNSTEVTILARATISGDVQLQGRDAIHTSADTVTFALRPVGSYVSVNDSLFNLNDIDPAKQGIQVKSTGLNGSYTLNNAPIGRWVLTASVRRYLTGHDTVVVKAGDTAISINPVKSGDYTGSELLGGDVAGYTDSLGRSLPDNFIDAADFNAINASLFKSLGDPAYNTFADVNQDSIVNGMDKDYSTANQTSNTGESGKKRPVLPTFKQTTPEGTNTDALLSLSGVPDAPVRMGETFDVSVLVKGAVAVRTYEAHIQFDPAKLEPVEIVSNGSLFEWYLHDLGAKIRGLDDLGFVNSIIGETPYGASGEGTLATIRFRSITRGGETTLKLNDAILINVKHDEFTPQFGEEITIPLSEAPAVYHDMDGNEIRALILAESDSKVDFNDFVILAQHFGSSKGNDGFDLRADINGDNRVDFADFLILSQDFGKVAVDAPAVKRASKVSPNTMGINDQASLSFKVDGQAKMGENLVVEVGLAQASALTGWGLTVGFDAAQYEFVEAIAPEGHLFAGQNAPIFLVHSDSEGRVSLANAIAGAGAASGEGSLARLVFRPRGDIEEARFEILEGELFDPSRLENVPSSSLLNVRAVPSEFALAQNYPNPFNPETTITYDLAANSDVRLDIYNVLGQVVRTLVSENQSAGRYRLSWLGDNSLGHQVASGVYFYRIQADAFHSVKKLMLLK